MKTKESDSNLVLKFKALSEPTRLRMIPHLGKPHTVKQIADILQMDHHSLYHHMRVLEKAGIVELVKTRAVGNIVEKYFKLTDNWVMFPQSYEDSDIKGLDHLVRQAVFSILEDLTKSARVGSDSGMVNRIFLSFKNEHLSEKRLKMLELIKHFINQMEKLEDEDGDVTYSVNMVHFKMTTS